jgi:hypothetical protein
MEQRRLSSYPCSMFEFLREREQEAMVGSKSLVDYVIRTIIDREVIMIPPSGTSKPKEIFRTGM